MEKNIRVTDQHGNSIGSTYPKRAKGLVKNGRAKFVDDCTIRLSAAAVPSDISHKKSEVNRMNYILFNPRGWILDTQARSNNPQNNYNGNNGNNGNEGFPFGVPLFGGNGGNGGNRNRFRHEAVKPAERIFITDFDGVSLTEMIQLGGWNDRGEIMSEEVMLQSDTDYTFVFWLNGGENDKSDEICQLQIVFSRQYNYPNVYMLNRDFIKPKLHYQGWELYLIPFHTAPSEQQIVTEFHFVAKGAPLSLKHAEVPDFYKDYVDSPDEYAGYRPQRHNIVFRDGWPSFTMYGGKEYSTEAIKRRLKNMALADAAGANAIPTPNTKSAPYGGQSFEFAVDYNTDADEEDEDEDDEDMDFEENEKDPSVSE